jgi:hypothetical protein
MPHETECPTTHGFTLAELLPDPNNQRADLATIPSEGPGPGPTEENGETGIRRLRDRPVIEAAKEAVQRSEANLEGPSASEEPLPSYWE